MINMDYSFNKFQKNALKRLLGLDKYKEIRENYKKCDISTDEKFKTNFNALYKIRRKGTWRDHFYNYFEKVKKDPNINFETILKELSGEKGYIEASFSSKMLATIDPNMPIWDKYVIKNLKLEVTGETREEKIESTIKNYDVLIKKEKELLNNPIVKDSIDKFRKIFPEYDLTDIKILDYILWNNREKDDQEQ